MNYLIDIEDIALTDRLKVGGKNYGLAVLHQAGIAIPRGYAITTDAFDDYVRDSEQASNNSLQGTPPRMHSGSSDRIRGILEAIDFRKRRLVVRSSGVSEDGSQYSFAGLFASRLNIQSLEGLVDAVKECYSSAFSSSVHSYQQQMTLPASANSMALVVQEMVDSHVSGTLFTVDPVTLNPDIAYVEATYGFGEGIASGLVEPDRYCIRKQPLQIIAKKRGRKQYKYQAVESGEGLEVVVNDNVHFTLSDEVALQLAEMAMLVERRQGCPQDMEFAITKDSRIYLTQTRPQIVRERNLVDVSIKDPRAPVMEGVSVAHGVAAGTLMESGIYCNQRNAIVIKEKLTVEAIGDLCGANGVVTDFLSLTSHPAILMREIGIPTIMLEAGFSAIHQMAGAQVTLDASHEKGSIYHGELERQDRVLASDELPKPDVGIIALANYRSSQLSAFLANTELEGLAMNGENAIYDDIRIHPSALLAYDNQPEELDSELTRTIADHIEGYDSGAGFLRGKMVERVSLLAAMLKPHHYIIYRFADMISSDYLGLIGGAAFERVEDNAAIGLRGAARILSRPDVFNIELEAIRIARAKFDVKFKLLIPFVRCSDEAIRICKHIADHQIDDPVGIMVETPASLFFASELVETVDFFAIGASDLAQLLTGSDRNSSTLNCCMECKDELVANAISLLFANLSMASTCIYLGPGIYRHIAKRDGIRRTNNTIKIATLPDGYLQTIREAADFPIAT